MSKAYVLLSGGIDSTTCLHLACKDHPVTEAISINYGQRHKKEIEYAKKSCQMLDVPHRVLDLSSVIPSTMLTDPKIEIPNASYSDIKKGVSPTYVPFRNGLILSAVTSTVVGERVHAAKTGKVSEDEEWFIYFGAHAEDAQNWAYADCTFEFLGAMANAIHVGTYRTVRLVAPLQWLDKKAIIELGTRLGVDWKSTWSCYAGGEQHCGVCPTCRARKAGFAAAGVSDPTDYAN
jgi:7-cyano-7-deazaguanine synthase